MASRHSDGTERARVPLPPAPKTLSLAVATHHVRQQELGETEDVRSAEVPCLRCLKHLKDDLQISCLVS